MSETTSADEFSLAKLPAPKVFHNATYDEAGRWVKEHYKPAVFKNLFKHWPIVQEAAKSDENTATYLKRCDQGRSLPMVKLSQKHQGRLFYHDDLKSVNFHSEARTLSYGLDKMQERTSGQSDTDYCFQCVSIKDNLPGLSTELDNPLLPLDTQSFIWLGNKITVAPHFDEATNLAVVVSGKRRFTLFPPEQIKHLYIGPLEYTPAGQPISLVNLHQPDLLAHPNYPKAYAEALSIELEPGDAIFIPSPWWHHVQSLGGLNILINYWWTQANHSTQMPYPAVLHTLQAFRQLSKDEREAWLSFVQHYAFDGDSSSQHLPNDAKGIQGDLTPKLKSQLHQWIMSQLR